MLVLSVMYVANYYQHETRTSIYDNADLHAVGYEGHGGDVCNCDLTTTMWTSAAIWGEGTDGRCRAARANGLSAKSALSFWYKLS